MGIACGPMCKCVGCKNCFDRSEKKCKSKAKCLNHQKDSRDTNFDSNVLSSTNLENSKHSAKLSTLVLKPKENILEMEKNFVENPTEDDPSKILGEGEKVLANKLLTKNQKNRAEHQMKRTQEMFNYLNEFCGSSITSKLFSLKTNETAAACSNQSTDIRSFQKLENILEKYIEYKKNKAVVSEKEIEPIKKVLKELKEEIWDENLINQLKELSDPTKAGSKSDPKKTQGIFSKNETENTKNTKSPQHLLSLNLLNEESFRSTNESKLSRTHKLMQNFYRYVEEERSKPTKEKKPLINQPQKTPKKAVDLVKRDSLIFQESFPIFQIRSNKKTRRRSLKEALDKREFKEFMEDTPKKNTNMKSKYVLSPYHSLVSNKQCDEDLLEAFFRNN